MLNDTLRFSHYNYVLLICAVQVSAMVQEHDANWHYVKRYARPDSKHVVAKEVSREEEANCEVVDHPQQIADRKDT